MNIILYYILILYFLHLLHYYIFLKLNFLINEKKYIQSIVSGKNLLKIKFFDFVRIIKSHHYCGSLKIKVRENVIGSKYKDLVVQNQYLLNVISVLLSLLLWIRIRLSK